MRKSTIKRHKQLSENDCCLALYSGYRGNNQTNQLSQTVTRPQIFYTLRKVHLVSQMCCMPREQSFMFMILLTQPFNTVEPTQVVSAQTSDNLYIYVLRFISIDFHTLMVLTFQIRNGITSRDHDLALT